MRQTPRFFSLFVAIVFALAPAVAFAGGGGGGTPAPSCNSHYYCSGSNVYHQTQTCSKTLVGTCDYGCAGGVCKQPPAQYSKAFSTPGTYSWTAPAGVSLVSVTVVGGGGGAGGSGFNGDGCAGAGGGSGGAYSNVSVPVTPGTQYPVVVGAGGRGGVAQECMGARPGAGSGGSSTFNGYTATGGGGGSWGSAGVWGGGGPGGTPYGVKGADSTWYECGPHPGGQNSTPWGRGGADSSGSCYSGGQPGSNGYVSIGWSDPPSCTMSLKSSILTWTSQNAQYFYIEGIGYVGASGSSQVSGLSYNGYVKGIGGSATCSTGTTNPNPKQCSAGGASVCGSDGNLHNSCGAVSQLCPSGCSSKTNTCYAGLSSCTHVHICSANGSKIIDSCTGATVSDCSKSSELCLSGKCVPSPVSFASFSATTEGGNAFTATGNLQIVPKLVRKGSASYLYWNAKNAASCVVTGPKNFKVSKVFSGAAGVATGPITLQSVFKLHCIALKGATPPTTDQSATVNLIPAYQEQ